MMCEFDALHCCSCCIVACDEKRLSKLCEHTDSVLHTRMHLLAQIDTSAESSSDTENIEWRRQREIDRGDGRADRRLQQQIDRQPRSARETDGELEIDPRTGPRNRETAL